MPFFKKSLHYKLKRNTSSTRIYYSLSAQKNTLEGNLIVIYFLCWNTKISQIFFIQKLNPKSHGAEVTIFWIKKNYPLFKVSCTRQVFRWINSKITKIQRRDCLRRKYVKGKRRKIGIFSKIDGKYCIHIV